MLLITSASFTNVFRTNKIGSVSHLNCIKWKVSKTQPIIQQMRILVPELAQIESSIQFKFNFKHMARAMHTEYRYIFMFIQWLNHLTYSFIHFSFYIKSFADTHLENSKATSTLAPNGILMMLFNRFLFQQIE